MSNRCLLTFFLSLVVLILYCPRQVSAQTTEKEESKQDAQYQAQTSLYLFQRSLDFEAETYLNELFLTWLYEGITSEAQKRRNENFTDTYDALSLLDLTTFEDSVYALPDRIEGALLDSVPPRIRYILWENLQREKYKNKCVQARRIKNRLISTGNELQLQRMFNVDLESAITTYDNGLYRQAVMRFNEIIERYDFVNLADIIYYRAECYLKLSMYEQARDDYQDVFRTSDEAPLRRRALERLIAISGEKSSVRNLNYFWDKYQQETSDARDEDYWQTLELTARYLMASGEWAGARQLFDMILPKSENFISSKLLAADCALAEYVEQLSISFFHDSSLIALNEARYRYDELAEKKIKGKGLTKEIRQEALLKLSYLDYLNADYYAASEKASRIKAKGEIAEKAVLVLAWSRFRVHDFGEVIYLCNKYFNDYPESQYFYEVFCLLGYSKELLGREAEAKGEYETVMTAIDDRREFHDINYEKKNVARAIGDLRRLEPKLFLEGRRELFDKYKQLNSQLKSIFERLKLTEGIKSSPVIRELLEEQKELYRIFDGLTSIEQELFEADDRGLTSKYDKMYAKLLDLATELKSGIQYHMTQKSLIQREEEQRFQDRFGDSLRVHFKHEWKSTETSLQRVRKLIEEAEVIGDAELLLELGEIELGLLSVQDRLFGVSTSLSRIESPEINSNLDHWSWFAYQRHSTAGLAFDYLYMRENRLKELDNYVGRINQIIAERSEVEEQPIELAVNLVPASEPGAEPYRAPSIELWEPPEAEGEPALDTSGTGEIPPEEIGEEIEPEGIEPGIDEEEELQEDLIDQPEPGIEEPAEQPPADVEVVEPDEQPEEEAAEEQLEIEGEPAEQPSPDAEIQEPPSDQPEPGIEEPAEQPPADEEMDESGEQPEEEAGEEQLEVEGEPAEQPSPDAEVQAPPSDQPEPGIEESAEQPSADEDVDESGEQPEEEEEAPIEPEEDEGSKAGDGEILGDAGWGQDN
ncbi:hypothetical protein HQ587_07725 [bacterium]|nr:hypothetical protein [bacterium]